MTQKGRPKVVYPLTWLRLSSPQRRPCQLSKNEGTLCVLWCLVSTASQRDLQINFLLVSLFWNQFQNGNLSSLSSWSLIPFFIHFFSKTKLNHFTILISTKKCNEPDNEEELTLFSLSTLYLICFVVSFACLFPDSVSNNVRIVGKCFIYLPWNLVKKNPDLKAGWTPVQTTRTEFQSSRPGHSSPSGDLESLRL